MFRPAIRSVFCPVARTITPPRAFSTTAARDFARLTVVGRLAGAPELITASSGREYVKYSIATNHGPRDNQQTSWFRISNFAPDSPSRTHLLGLQKGSLMLVEGDASLKTYEDGEGRKITSLNVNQRSYQVLQKPSSSDTESSTEPSSGSSY
ncbi:ssDNA-binding protein, mitochondrial [Myotisia sp. PD_48]|nr:ssDNA-binding protein, mitochondrial [Myotisia sp. PD_48]